MAPSVNHVLAQMQRWTAAQTADLADAVLIERYVHQRDETAFATLVARYGAMVLRVCRGILGTNHETEDAFQAAFLILACKASSLRRPDALPGWLHAVTRRVALKARAQVNGRFHSASSLDDALADPHPDPLRQLTARELLDVVDEEVRHLPSAQRSAVVLCCLEGHTREEAARRLGWTLGAVKNHLQRGRQRLQKRLNRRGIALPAALVVVAVSRGEAASPLLLRSTVHAALRGGIGNSAAALAHSVLRTMLFVKLVGMTALVLTVALAASATVALVYRGPAEETPEEKTPTAAVAPKEAEARKSGPRTDAQGDPLPAGAIARLGTVRFRHGSSVSSLIFTPDGKRLMSLGASARVWDVATGKELRHLAPPTGKVWEGGHVTPDGRCIVAAVSQAAAPLELWDVDSGKKVVSLGEKCSPPIRFSPDGKLLATLSVSRFATVDVWDIAHRKKLCSLKAHPRMAFPIVFSTDARKLLTRGLSGEDLLWDVATGRQLQEFKQLDWKADGAAFFPLLPMMSAFSLDGNLLATIEDNEKQTTAAGKVSWKTRISLWDTTTGKRTRLLSYPAYEIVPGQAFPLRGVAFTPDGKALVTAGPDRFIHLWNPDTGKELRRLPLDGLPASLALSRDGKKLAVPLMGVLGNTAIRVLDLKSGQPTTTPGGHLGRITWVALTPDGRTAVTGTPEEPLFVWDVATGRVRQRLKGHDGPILALQLSEDGRTLFTSGLDKTLCIWDLATGTERRRITVERDLAQLSLKGLARTPDGKTLAVMDSSKTIHIFGAASGAERQHFPGPEQLVGMGLTPDGCSLIGWSGDGKVGVWETANGHKLREYSLPRYYSAALSPDSRLLAMGAVDHSPRNAEEEIKSMKGSLILKDLQTGQVVHYLDNLPSVADRMAFSPDGRMLAWTGFKDNAIRVLEVASGCERHCLTGHRGRISALAFSADGRRLLSGSDDTTALLWDLADRSPATLPVRQVKALWADLLSEDAARAYQAVHQLAASKSSIPFLRKRLQPVAPVDEKRVARLIADLDNDDFAIRRNATAELSKLADQPITVYRKVLEGKPSIEMRRRLEALLERAGPAWWDVSGERLRSLRAVEALELAGTKEARETLAIIADGASGARLTEQARAALERLTTGQR